MTAYSTGSTSILVLWGPVPKEGRHGIVGYKVFYKKENEPNNWRNASCSQISWCEINDLDYGIWYNIRVAGFTVKGYGPSTQVEAKTFRGGKLLTDIIMVFGIVIYYCLEKREIKHQKA